MLEFYRANHPRERIVLITLTFKNSFQALADQDKLFKAAFGRLRRMKKWKDHISGAFCSYEFTRSETGWHYHAHILCFRKSWYDQTTLANDWQEAARERGTIADIRAVSNLSEGLKHLLHYCFKPVDLERWTTNEVKQFQAMSRIKLSECFGALRGLRITNTEADHASEESNSPLFVGCPCPECGEPLERVKVFWRELEGYARRLQTIGSLGRERALNNTNDFRFRSAFGIPFVNQ